MQSVEVAVEALFGLEKGASDINSVAKYVTGYACVDPRLGSGLSASYVQRVPGPAVSFCPDVVEHNGTLLKAVQNKVVGAVVLTHSSGCKHVTQKLKDQGADPTEEDVDSAAKDYGETWFSAYLRLLLEACSLKERYTRCGIQLALGHVLLEAKSGKPYAVEWRNSVAEKIIADVLCLDPEDLTRINVGRRSLGSEF